MAENLFICICRLIGLNLFIWLSGLNWLNWVTLDLIGWNLVEFDWIGLNGLNWAGLDWIGRNCNELGWFVLNWEWIVLNWIELGWNWLNWIELGCIGIHSFLFIRTSKNQLFPCLPRLSQFNTIYPQFNTNQPNSL